MRPRLTIALTRGRMVEEVLPLLRQAGVAPEESMNASRKLIFDTVATGVRIIVMRSEDVLVYVERGSADLGITGKDTLLERGGSGYYERLDLGICACRLMTAAPKDAPPVEGRLRVATKFVNITRRYFALQSRQVDVIKLSGAVELAPIIGLADQIVDIVETGTTLAANGLVPLETIAEISGRVVVNKAAMKMKYAVISDLVSRLEQAVGKSHSARGS